MFDSIDTFCVSVVYILQWFNFFASLKEFLKSLYPLDVFKLASDFFSQSLSSCKGCIFQLIINIGV